MMPTVSIVLPTYNRAYCLARAVRSVARQRYQDWELLVIDDGSTDGTASLCESLAPWLHGRMRYYYLENGGVSRARNFGIEQASGPLVAFLDSDDYWMIDKLGVQVAALHDDPGAVFCFSNFSTFHEDGHILVRAHPMSSDFNGMIYPRLLEIRNNIIVTPSVLCTREALMSGGLFDESMTICEDIDLWSRICRHARTVAMNASLVGVNNREGAYRFRSALDGRVRLYRNAALRDPGLRGRYECQLFQELFEVFEDVAKGQRLKQIEDAAALAARCSLAAMTDGDMLLLDHAIALMRSSLEPLE